MMTVKHITGRKAYIFSEDGVNTYYVHAGPLRICPSADEIKRDIATTAIIRTSHRINSKAFLKELAEVERDMGVRFHYYENPNAMRYTGRRLIKYHTF